jgi:ketosteroid isomerase-like protein
VKKALISLCIVFIASSAAAASFASDEQTLRNLDREMALATYMTDINWFRLHLSDDYVLITSTGVLQTKAELLDHLAKDDVKMEPYQASDVRIHAHGSTAIVTGRIVQKYTAGGDRVIAELRYSSVWVKTDEGWFNISGQISPISIKRERVK